MRTEPESEYMTGDEPAEHALLSAIDGVEQDGLVFCSNAYALFDAVRSGPSGVTRLRLLQGKLIDRLLGEVLPLCRYIQEHYRAGRHMSVKWINGDQPFDALVTQRGAWVTGNQKPGQYAVEITTAQHPDQWMVGEAIEEHGFVGSVEGLRRVKVNGKKSIETAIVGRMGMKHVEYFVGYLSTAIAKKTQKQPPYPPQSTLVVVCNLTTWFYPDEWEMLVEGVRKGIDFGPFEEIYVYDAASHMDRLFVKSWLGGVPA